MQLPGIQVQLWTTCDDNLPISENKTDDQLIEDAQSIDGEDEEDDAEMVQPSPCVTQCTAEEAVKGPEHSVGYIQQNSNESFNSTRCYKQSSAWT